MSPATWPRPSPERDRMLVVDPRAGRWADRAVGDLPSYVRAGDVVVVNDAATLPASLAGSVRGEAIEVRLVGRAGTGDGEQVWSALLFGAGDWRTKTEDRPPPPRVQKGDVIVFGGDGRGANALRAGVRAIEADARGRVATIAFDAVGAALWSALYAVGRPVQYAYVERPLELWHVQTAYASRPWAVEMPSAGRPLTWSILTAIARAGARLAVVTHAAGLSSTGDEALDATLPRPERYAIPAATAAAIAGARAAGSKARVIAVGTSVVRALEGAAAAHGGELVASEGVTSLLLGPGFEPRVVGGLFTGMHEPTATHYALMQAFAPLSLLRAAQAHAERAGYLAHEFGDSTLLLDGALER